MRKMKKRIFAAALCLVLVLGCGGAVFAASETAADRLYDLTVAEGFTITPLDADGAAITAAEVNMDEDEDMETVYSAAEMLELGFTGEADQQYAVFLLYGGEIPTESNIRYIYQLPGVDGAMTATIIPTEMAEPGTYYVCLSSYDEYVTVGSFEVSAPEYVLGDVNADGYITAYDASLVLQRAAGTISFDSRQMKAGDTNLDGTITAYDASLILQRAAGIITEF